MRAAVISLGSVSSLWIVDELKKRFDEVDNLELQEIEVSLSGKSAQVLYKGSPLKHYDVLYARGSFRYANVLRSITEFESKECYMPLKPFTFNIAHDKVLTHLKLQKFKVPQPLTYLVSTAAAAKKILKKISYPIVMKLLGGTHGMGVVIADSIESASSMIDAWALLKQQFLIQEYIETNGTDLRALVVGGRVVASMKRKAKAGEKRANVHIGGTVSKHELDADCVDVAVAAAQAVGADIAAIDILPSSRGPLVLEVNISPGLQGITKATGINIASIIADFLAEKAKPAHESGIKAALKDVLPEQEIHTSLDFRGRRILLPELATMASKLKQTDSVEITASKGQIVVKKQ